MMWVRRYNLVWLFCALLLVCQSLVPESAMAFVSVRCVGAPSVAPACAQAVMPIADTNGVGSYLAPMSCCRHMNGVCHMTRASDAGRNPHPVKLSALPCLVTVSPLTSERPAATTVSIRQWMLVASPALAPPVATNALAPLEAAALPSHRLRIHFPLSPSAKSHGLRAPPVA